MKDFWKQIDKPILALAPMDGYTDSAYRQVVKKINPDVICFSEFYSADGLVHSKFLADSVLPHDSSEKPLIIQIFGKDPDMFAKAGKIIERYNIAGIDINMGCPAKKVVRSGHGSKLMIERDTAFRIVEEINKATRLPISVKTRLGREGPESLIEFVRGLESAGASLITVHGRTFKQAYTGEADFSQIYELKKSVNIPVIANGDIKNYADGMNKLQHLDGFMIGRASFGNPWCFSPDGYTPTLGEILDMMIFHADKLISTKGERKGTLDIRKHLVEYLHNFRGVKSYRKRLVQIASLDELRQIIDDIREEFKDNLDLTLN